LSDFQELVGLSKFVVEQFIQRRSLVQIKGRPPKQSAREEVLFLFIHLRQYPVDIFLAVIEEQSKQTACNSRLRMLDWFYQLLKERLSFHSLEWRLQRSFQLFHTTYTFLLDGTEQPTVQSSDPFLDAQLFSAKSNQHCITILIFGSADGKKVLGLSFSFPGSVSDLSMMRKTLLEWKKELTDNDWGLADAGFEGLEESGINLTTVKPQSNSNPLLSSKRIEIEHLIERLKNWKALKYKLRILPLNDPIQYHHKCWTIIAVLINDYC